MKYDATKDVNIKRHPESGIYYFKRGSVEKSLQTDDWVVASRRKKLMAQDAEFAGDAAFTTTIAEAYGDEWSGYRGWLIRRRDGKIKKEKPLRQRTLKEIESLFENHLLPHWGNKKIAYVTPTTWHRYCQASPVSDLANHRVAMLGLLKWCQREGKLRNVPQSLPIPHHARRKRKIISEHQLELIFTHASGSLRLFLSLALFNGLRRTEIMTLKVCNVDLQKRFIVIESAFNKKHRTRSLPINKFVTSLIAARIADFRAQRIKSVWLFPNAVNEKRHADLSGLKTAWATVLKKAGLKDITWHDFRATFEKHLNKQTEFTEMQKEKFADASSDVQKKIYVSMDHEDLRGLEDSVKLPKLAKILGLGRGFKGKSRDEKRGTA